MGKKRFRPEPINPWLREVEIHTSEGKTIAQSVRHIGVTEQTYYCWRKEYGGFSTGQAKRFKELEKENSRLKRFKELEKENSRLKRLVADLSLDNAILKDFASGNW